MNAILAIDTQNLKYALEITWKGMLAIFLVMAIIYAVILILNKVTVIPAEKVKAPFVKAGDKIKTVFKKKDKV
ncbi:MAG: hypothetical protein WC292_00890 [Clostridia bacterium]